MSETAIHILGGYDSRRDTHHIDLKWCFNCRERHIHTWVVLYDSEPTYYDPTGSWRCAKCDQDHTRFPGTEWWYGE